MKKCICEEIYTDCIIKDEKCPVHGNNSKYPCCDTAHKKGIKCPIHKLSPKRKVV